MNWQTGHIFELGLDGHGYIINNDDHAFSHPFNVSTFENPNIRRKSLEGASVRYRLQNERVTDVELTPALAAK